MTYSWLSDAGLLRNIERAQRNISKLSPTQRGQLALCVVEMQQALERRSQ